MNFRLPRPIDEEENKLFLASRVSVQRLKDDENVPKIKDSEAYIWNIYFWAVFEHRFKKYNACKGIVKQMFNIMKVKN